LSFKTGGSPFFLSFYSLDFGLVSLSSFLITLEDLNFEVVDLSSSSSSSSFFLLSPTLFDLRFNLAL
jgi:hypothetical protein